MPWERKTVTKRKMHTAIHTPHFRRLTISSIQSMKSNRKKISWKKKYILQEVINYMKKKITRKKNNFKRFKVDADRQIHYASIGLRDHERVKFQSTENWFFFVFFYLCVSRVLSMPIYIDAHYIWVENIDENIKKN